MLIPLDKDQKEISTKIPQYQKNNISYVEGPVCLIITMFIHFFLFLTPMFDSCNVQLDVVFN